MSPHYQLGMLNLWEWHELGAHVNNVNSGWRIMLMEFRTTNFDHHKNTVNFYHLKSLKKVWYYFPGITEKRQQCLQIVLIVWLLWLIVNSTKTLVSGQMHPFASVLQILQMENLVLLQRTRKGKIAKASVVIHCCCKGWKASQSNILPVKLIICICGSFNWQGLLELMFDLRLDIRKKCFWNISVPWTSVLTCLMRAFIYVFLFSLCDFVQHAVNPPGQRVHEDDLGYELNDTKEEA